MQEKRFDAFATQAESDGLSVMDNRLGALLQRLVGRGEIVVASRVQFIRRNGLRQCLGRQFVIAGRLIQQAQNVEGGRLGGVERQNLLAQYLGVD